MNYIGIFEGGGVKGIAHIGALRALEERGFFCKKASGTSVGAIIASLVVAGYSSIELTNILFNLDINKLKERSRLLHSIRHLGIYSSNPLEEYIDLLLKDKGIETYQDLKIGNDYLLKVVATDITKRKKIILPDDLFKYSIHPDSFKVSKSVVMSATYPFFYKPLKLNKSLIVDGGVSDNFPINIFNDNASLIIGFNLVDNIKDIKKSEDAFIIKIPTFNIKAMNFNISLELKKKLYISGYMAGMKFLDRYFLSKWK